MRCSIAVPLLFLAAGGFSLAPPPELAKFALAAESDDGIEDLKKTLGEVLRARRPEEFAFLDRVMELVEDGTLPRSLVVSTFNWARKKPKHPFQYFEQGLRVRAKKIGVDL